MRSKRLELQEAKQKQKQKPSTTKRQEARKSQRLSTAEQGSASVNNGGSTNEVVTDVVDERLNAVALKKQSSSATKSHSALGNVRRAKEIVTDAVDERFNAIDLENETSSATKSRSAFLNDQRVKEVVTDAVDERLNGRRANEIVTDAVDERLHTSALERSSATKKRVSFVNALSSNEILTDAMDERLNVVAPEKQKSSATKQRNAFVDEFVTDVVDERLNFVALEKQSSSATKPFSAFISGRREKENVTDAVGERLNAIALEKQRSLTIKPRISFVNGRKAKKIVTDAVDERPNAVVLQKQRSSKTKPCSAIINDSWANEIVSIAADAELNAVAIKKQKLSTKQPCSASVNGTRAIKIVTDPVNERLNAAAERLDAGSDIRDEDTDRRDSWSDIRDEDADILDANGDSDVQFVEDQSFSSNSDEDADILDANGDTDHQIVEDQWLLTNSDKDADIRDADGDSDYQFVEDQSLPTNSENSLGKRKREMVRSQVTDPYSESNNANCSGQGSTSMPSVTRIPIIFDKYGRPCDVGSEEFTTDIGRIVRAHCRPAIESWKIVPNSIKDNIWKDIVVRYVVPEVYKPSILSRACKSWKNWKSQLRNKLDKYETIAERKIHIPWRLITKREDWESFVDFCNTDEDRKRRTAGRKIREACQFIQSCGRKGIYRKIYELEKESSAGEVNRAAIFVDTHISKNKNDPGEVKMRLVKELVEANPDGQKDIDNDAVAMVYGRDSRGSVKGMGGGVSRTMIRASAPSLEILRKVQQENKSLQSDIHLLRTQLGIHTPIHTSRPPNQSAPHTQNRTYTPSNQPASHIQNHTSTPSIQFASQAPEASNLPARSRLAHEASNLPVRSSLAPDESNLPARSRLAPDVSNLPARSCLAPPASNLPSSSCFIKNFKGRTIALGSFSTADPPPEHVYTLIIEEIFDRDAELFDKDGKLGDIMIGGVINWPKACVESNLPVSSCFLRNFKRRIIAFGSFNTADPPMEHVYSIIVKEIYDREADLFDEDGKLGDITIGGVINWPKACIKPC